MALRLPGGLRTEIVASVSILALVAILFVGILMIQAVEQGFVREQVEGIRGVKNAIQWAIQMMIEGPGRGRPQRVSSQIRGLLTGLMQDELNLIWVDAHGRVLGGKAPVATGEVFLDGDLEACLGTGQEMTRVLQARGWWPIWGARSLVIAAPLRSPGGEIRGAIRIETPIRGVWTSLFGSRWVLGLYVLLVMIVLVVFGSYLISRNVLHPLKRLIQASERISQGEYELPWEGYPPHEIGRLAEALRLMAQKLERHQAALRQQLEELERSNRALVQAHRAMVRSEKLASAGRLAAGVAHEIGNPIGSILGYVEIVLSQVADPALRDCLQRTRTEAERVQRTLRSLLDLARPSARPPEWVDVESVARETLTMLAGHGGMKGIEVSRSTQEGLLPVWGDRDQIKQVLVNLLLNALDALDGGGTLAINTGIASHLPEDQELVPPPRRRGEPSDVDYTRMRRMPPHALLPASGPYVFVQVRDTGAGIPEESLQHLFEPFYTTKDPGKGTGLGLTVSLGIVESYGGRIQVETQPGKGSCFTVYFPAGSPGAGRDTNVPPIGENDTFCQ